MRRDSASVRPRCGRRWRGVTKLCWEGVWGSSSSSSSSSSKQSLANRVGWDPSSNAHGILPLAGGHGSHTKFLLGIAALISRGGYDGHVQCLHLWLLSPSNELMITINNLQIKVLVVLTLILRPLQRHRLTKHLSTCPHAHLLTCSPPHSASTRSLSPLSPLSRIETPNDVSPRTCNRLTHSHVPVPPPSKRQSRNLGIHGALLGFVRLHRRPFPAPFGCAEEKTHLRLRITFPQR